MRTFIEMYSLDQYTSWEHAAIHGGIYSCTVDSKDPLALEDAMKAARTAALMMDGSSRIDTRVVTRSKK